MGGNNPSNSHILSFIKLLLGSHTIAYLNVSVGIYAYNEMTDSPKMLKTTPCVCLIMIHVTPALHQKYYFCIFSFDLFLAIAFGVGWAVKAKIKGYCCCIMVRKGN